VSRRTPGGDTDGRFVYTDLAGILDVALRRRIENWPSVQHGDNVLRPAELWSIKFTGEGLGDLGRVTTGRDARELRGQPIAAPTWVDIGSELSPASYRRQLGGPTHTCR
jgi:hypothetical protein